MPKLLIVLLLLAPLDAAQHSEPTNSPDTPDLVGDWKGTSLCQVRPSPCHDENVVFRLSRPRRDKIRVQADKIVNGEAQTMGIDDWAYDKTARSLTYKIPRGTWKLIVAGEGMDGTLVTAPGSIVFRKVHLEKSK